MQLYREILSKILENEVVEIAFPNLDLDAMKIVDLASYKALQIIKSIIEDDSLEDKECFMKIEEIVSLFESLGSDGGNRHDFG